MVGGTFDPLHDGHKVLLDRSFEIARSQGHVVIGLTTDSFASRKVHPIRPFEVRKSELEQYINNRNFLTPFIVEPLQDRFGSALDADFDAIIVSEETLPVAVEINKLRRGQGRKKLISTRSAVFLLRTDAGSRAPGFIAERSIFTGT